MTDWMQEILNQHGQTVTVCTKEAQIEACAFLQPIVQKSEQAVQYQTAIGSVDERLWLYLGKEEVQPNDRIIWNGMEFWVHSSRPYYLGQKLTHWWAALKIAKEAAL